MPASLIEINGSIKYELGDSKMPPLLKWLETYSYEALEGVTEGEKQDSIFAEMVTLMAKAHYGDDFEFDMCIVKKNIEQGIHTVTWTPSAMSVEDYGDLMSAFEPPVDDETYNRIIDKDCE